MRINLMKAAVAGSVLMGCGATQIHAEGLQLSVLGTFDTGQFDESAAEIPAYDPASQRLFVVNATKGVDIISIADPTNPTFVSQILAPGSNSVDVHNGIVAVAVEAAVQQDAGAVKFFDTNGASLGPDVATGALPDMLTFTPDGSKILVANEGQPNDNYDVDPEGSVTIIDLSGGVGSATPTQVSFSGFNSQKTALQASGVRIFGPSAVELDGIATVAQDVEPEYIAVSPDGSKAYVALQENNAMAILDIASSTVTDIVPLGFKDHSLADSGFTSFDGINNSSNMMDASNRDGGINFDNWPTLGMYQPDAIAAYEANGNTYIISANEGDSRDYDGFSEEGRVKDLALDAAVFPDAATLQLDENLGRIKTTTANGNTDADPEFEEIFTYGSRSFSIWQVDGNDLTQVYDSGDDFERITANTVVDDFNSTNDENNSFDNRSDDKGPEPEGITLGVVDGRMLAFIGLERVGGVMVYDVTNPNNPVFVDYSNNRDFSADLSVDGNNDGVPDNLNTVGDLGPEGLLFIPASISPNSQSLLVVANEVSGTTTIFAIPEPRSALILAGAGLLLATHRRNAR